MLKVYQYKIYQPDGTYLGMLANVNTDFSYNQQIASTFVQMEVGVSQSDPDTLTVNDNLIKVYEVSSYYPAGRKVFDGYISKWRATFGGDGDGGMLLTCQSHGQDASQYIIEAGDTAYINQLTENGTSFQVGDQDALGQSWTVRMQTFTVAANTVIGSVDIMVSTQEAADLTVLIKQKVGSNPDMAADTTIMSGTVALASGLVKSVQHVAFNSPTQLNTGTTYEMVVEWSSAGVSTCQVWGSSANPYANGTVWSQVFAPPASWLPSTQTSGSDLYFVIYQHGGSVTTTYTNRDPTFMLTDLMTSYEQRGGLIQIPPNPITPIISLPYTDATEPTSNWGIAYAQPFTPAADMTVNIVQLFIGVSSGTYGVNVQICRGNPSLDTVNVIGGTESYTFGGSNVQLGVSGSQTLNNPTPGIVGFSFATPLNLTGGVQYYVLVEFGQNSTILMKGAGSTDTISSPFSTGYYGLVPSNNTSIGMTTHAANPGFYVNLGYALPLPAVLNAGYAATGVSTSYTFKQQTMLKAIQVLASLSPSDWYWYVSPEDNVLTFKQSSTTADLTLVKGRHTSQVTIEATKETIVNQVYFTGGPVAGVNISVKRTVDVGNNRVGLAQIGDNRVVATAPAIIISDDYLDQFANETYYTTAMILDSTMDTNLIQLGMMLGFRGYGNFVDALLLQVVGKTKTPDGVKLQLGTLPLRSSKAVADIDAGLAYLETVANPSTPS